MILRCVPPMVAIYKPFVWWMTKNGHHKSQKEKQETNRLLADR